MMRSNFYRGLVIVVLLIARLGKAELDHIQHDTLDLALVIYTESYDEFSGEKDKTGLYDFMDEIVNQFSIPGLTRVALVVAYAEMDGSQPVQKMGDVMYLDDKNNAAERLPDSYFEIRAVEGGKKGWKPDTKNLIADLDSRIFLEEKGDREGAPNAIVVIAMRQGNVGTEDLKNYMNEFFTDPRIAVRMVASSYKPLAPVVIASRYTETAEPMNLNGLAAKEVARQLRKYYEGCQSEPTVSQCYYDGTDPEAESCKQDLGFKLIKDTDSTGYCLNGVTDDQKCDNKTSTWCDIQCVKNIVWDVNKCDCKTGTESQIWDRLIRRKYYEYCPKLIPKKRNCTNPCLPIVVIVICSIGGGVLLIGIGVGIYLLKRKRKGPHIKQGRPQLPPRYMYHKSTLESQGPTVHKGRPGSPRPMDHGGRGSPRDHGNRGGARSMDHGGRGRPRSMDHGNRGAARSVDRGGQGSPRSMDRSGRDNPRPADRRQHEKPRSADHGGRGSPRSADHHRRGSPRSVDRRGHGSPRSAYPSHDREQRRRFSITNSFHSLFGDRRRK